MIHGFLDSLVEMAMNATVLVVGAGPVGLTMAAELARYGVSVRIVEKCAQRTDKSKALVIWSRTLELMDRMGCGASFVACRLQGQRRATLSPATAGRPCQPGYDADAASVRAHASAKRN